MPTPNELREQFDSFSGLNPGNANVYSKQYINYRNEARVAGGEQPFTLDEEKTITDNLHNMAGKWATFGTPDPVPPLHDRWNRLICPRY